MKLPAKRYTITLQLNESELRQLQEQTRRLKRNPHDWDDLERVAKAVMTVDIARRLEHAEAKKGK